MLIRMSPRWMRSAHSWASGLARGESDECALGGLLDTPKHDRPPRYADRCPEALAAQPFHDESVGIIQGLPEAAVPAGATTFDGDQPRRIVASLGSRSRAALLGSSISGSCFGSPTRTTFAPARSAWSSARASTRVPTIPASSITSTVLGSIDVRSSRPSNRVNVEDGMPAADWSSAAARAASAAPMT